MKNILLLSALLCIAFTSRAQFTTGQKMIGGQISGAYVTSNSSIFTGTQKQNNVSFSLSLSKFKSPVEHRSFGVYYSYAHSSSGTTGQFSNNSNGVGIFFERTKLEQLAKRFYFTYTGAVNASATFYRTRDNGANSTSEDNSYTANLSGNIGLLYQVNQRFLFTCNLVNLLNVGFSHMDSKTTSGTVYSSGKSNGVFLTTGLTGLSLNSLSIGAKYMLKK